MARTNPLADILRELGREDLARLVRTIDVSYETSSEISEYPVESGSNIADHTSVKPARIVIAGQVLESVEGAREVDQVFRDMQARGDRVDVITPRAAWDNCVAVLVQSDININSLRGMSFSVEFIQVQIADVEQVDTAPILTEYADDLGFSEYLELNQPGFDLTNSVTDEEAPGARVQSRLVDFDQRDFVRRQMQQLIGLGITSQDLRDSPRGYFKAIEYAKEVLGESSDFFNALEDVNPPFILGANTFEVPLPDLEDIADQAPLQDRLLAESSPRPVRRPSDLLAKPTRFRVPVTLRNSKNNVFETVLTFKYEFTRLVGGGRGGAFNQDGSREPETPGFENSLGTWYLTFGGRRGVTRTTNVRLTPGTPIPIGDGSVFGAFYVIPRLDVKRVDQELSQYDAFVGIDGNDPGFVLLHVSQPGDLLPRITDDEEIMRLAAELADQ